MAPHEAGHGDTPALPDALPIPVVDNHAHLDIARGDAPAMAIADAVTKAASVGVDRIIQIGCDLEAAQWTVDNLDAYPALLGGVALHPNEVPRLRDEGGLEQAWATIERLSAHPRIRVIGETGLDYFRTGPEGVEVQQESLRWHIDLAKRTGKALQIHDREAHDDVLRILAEEGAPEKTVLHCFSGDINMARACVEAGYFLSFAGTVTFKSAGALRDALAIVPLDRVLVETDAPYLTPMPWRGSTNASYLIPHTVRAMATVLNVAVPTLCSALSENSERVYGPW
ncbi:TatD family hydrolase [Kribbia dieselivorans]|uniref:TatD family hydrolase n=1 Tax=Kribbia dieselivorans TaxID=331526 RepID=UPI0008386965|nr:TatD family hydrolase [Kribbia dieselivorans]